MIFLKVCFLIDQIHMRSNTSSVQNCKCFSEKFCFVTKFLQRWETKRLEVSKTQTAPFWLVEKKHPPTRLFLIKDFPSARVLFSVLYIMFSLQAHEHRYTQGQRTACCERTAVTLTNLLQYGSCMFGLFWTSTQMECDVLRTNTLKHTENVITTSETERTKATWHKLNPVRNRSGE